MKLLQFCTLAGTGALVALSSASPVLKRSDVPVSLTNTSTNVVTSFFHGSEKSFNSSLDDLFHQMDKDNVSWRFNSFHSL
jgi:hypothetical protein